MMLANFEGRPKTPSAGLWAQCPTCSGAVIAKCGPIVTPHWAHAVGKDCDPWSEPESQWHRGWKIAMQACGAQVEVTMGNHRADALTHLGVVELQHSSISVIEARAREEFYGRMVWLFDMRDEDRWDRVHFGARGFWWKHGSRTQAALRRPIFWQTPDLRVLRVQMNTVANDRGTRVLGRVLAESSPEAFLRAVTAAGAA